MKLKIANIVLVLIASIALAACGGGGSGGSTNDSADNGQTDQPVDNGGGSQDPDSRDAAGTTYDPVVADSRLEVISKETDMLRINRIDLFDLVGTQQSVPETERINLHSVQAGEDTLEYDWNLDSTNYVGAMSALTLHADDGQSYSLIRIAMNGNDSMLKNAGRCSITPQAKVECKVPSTDDNVGTNGIQTTDISPSISDHTGQFEARAKFCDMLERCVEVSLGEVTVNVSG